MKLYLTGIVDITTLTQVLSEIASFYGEDSKVTLADTPIALDIAQFVEDPEEQKTAIRDMLDALAKYPVQARAHDTSHWEKGAVEERRLRLREGSPEVIYRVDADGNVL